ncbi:MAG TPA: sulfite exporter TauE/SafE family protein, partial [Desulfoprunum sp.]|nr:sulfite exporter TauE/SafE family protein [Desulfoprunum sp.]
MMKSRFRILPWLGLAMVMLLGAQTGHAVESGNEAAAPAVTAAAAPSIAIDKTELKNGGTIKVSGKGEPGKPVFIEVWSEGHDVRASRFDGEKDKETGKRPYIFYLSSEMPAYYKI